MNQLLNCILGGLLLLYPLAVYFGIQYLQPWEIASLLLASLILRLAITRTSSKSFSPLLILLGIVYCIFAMWSNNLITLRFYPVMINFGLLTVFVSSLFYPPPVIERLARLQHPELPEQGIKYTRKVTVVWCLFFMINGLISLTTAIWSSFEWWSLYNGFISYIFMAVLMGVEYWVRIRTQDHVR
jgi:uncharacterized membrane protein